MTESETRQEESGKGFDAATEFLNNAITIALRAATLVGFAALAVLAVRAMLRLELRWDAWWYHIPFAAKRAGLGVTYEMLPLIKDRYDGFPPLPEFLEGALWRVTGSLNAADTINILALGVFLYYCHRILKAGFPVAAVICLTAPVVIIHAATIYVDLFSAALLAIGVTALFGMMLFDRWADRCLLCWGLAGLVGASWSKSLLLPIVIVCLLCFLAIYAMRFRDRGYRGMLFLAVVAALVSAAPYLKNLIVYHNPIWPVQMPVLGDRFPYTYDTRALHPASVPPPLADMSQPGLFLHSVLEIGHPTEYPNRERWTLDQGNAYIAFRSGGFWNIAVVTAVLAAILLGFLFKVRKGWMLLGALAAMWLFTAIQSESQILRYYMFLPLTMAAIIGMLLHRVRAAYPATTLVLLAVFLGEFAWMVKVNHNYYRVESIDYQEAAEAWGMARWWPLLKRGETYCAVGFEPAGIFLTGPTMKEFHIIDRPDMRGCPPTVNVLVPLAAK